MQGEVDNCCGSLPCGLSWSFGRTDGPLAVRVVSLGAHVSNQRSRCVREGLGDVQNPVQLDVQESFVFAHVQRQDFVLSRLNEVNLGVCVSIATPMFCRARLMKIKPQDRYAGALLEFMASVHSP